MAFPVLKRSERPVWFQVSLVHLWVNASAPEVPAGRHGDGAGWTLSAAYLCGSAVWDGSRGLKLRDVTNVVAAPLDSGFCCVRRRNADGPIPVL